METLEELKAIQSKADAGGYTQVSLSGGSFYRFDGQNLIVYDGDEIECIEYEIPATRSLSDIKRIIELMGLNQEMHLQVSGYLYGEDWSHWQEFNAKRFSL